MKRIYTFLFATVFLLNSILAQNVGEIAPDFTLKDLNNQNFTLSQNKGKVILVFFVGFSCPLCVASAPSVKSKLINTFESNSNFQTLVIDTWDGSTSGVLNFKNTTNLNALYLQKGKSVANSWSITYDRLVVVNSKGEIAFKGTRAAQSDADVAKNAIQNALTSLTTSVNRPEVSGGFTVGQNYPNPFQNESTIEFVLSEASDVQLSIFDITGKTVGIPVQNYYSKGKHSVKIERGSLQQGVYFYRIDAGNFSATKRMVVN